MGPIMGALAQAGHLTGLLQLGGQKGDWLGGNAGPTADLAAVLTGRHLPMQGLKEAYGSLRDGLRGAAMRSGRADDGFRRRTPLPGTSEWAGPPTTFNDRYGDWPLDGMSKSGVWAGMEGAPAEPQVSAAQRQGNPFPTPMQDTGSNANPFPVPYGQPPQGNPFPAPTPYSDAHNIFTNDMSLDRGREMDITARSFPPFFRPNIR